MWVHQFSTLLAGWLNESGHPGITRVRTCAEIGRHEQPVGVAVTLSDGWLWILQTVGSAPDGGDVNRSGESVRPDRFDGEWSDRPDYQAARRQFEDEQASHAGPRTRTPQASHAALLDVARAAIDQASHPEVRSVVVPSDRLVLLVDFVDGSKVYGLPSGFIGPGATDLVKA